MRPQLNDNINNTFSYIKVGIKNINKICKVSVGSRAITIGFMDVVIIRMETANARTTAFMI